MRVANVAWNVAGLSIPLAIAAATIPSLISTIGNERFGLLAIAWGIIGFASILDFGLGRSTTHLIAGHRGRGRYEQIPTIVGISEKLSLKFSGVGAILLIIAITLDAHQTLKYPGQIELEVKGAAYLLALAIPIQTLSAVHKGINEAFENFRIISLIRIGLGVANFLGPYIVSVYTENLTAIVSTLLVSRLLAYGFYRRAARSEIRRVIIEPFTPENHAVSRDIRRSLITFGGWLTVSNVVHPIVSQADRLLIGALISATAVSYYAIPYEIVTQCLVLVGAITTVLFPRLTYLLTNQPLEADLLFKKWLAIALIVMALIATLIILFIQPVLQTWLAGAFNEQSVAIAQILSIGLVSYTVGTMYTALIHAQRRSDITAKVHLVEAVIFIPALYFLVKYYGVYGASIGWVIRTTLNAVALFTSAKLIEVRSTGNAP